MKFIACDACGKEVRDCTTDWRTSDGRAGTGAFLCNRKRCVKRRNRVELAEGVEGLVKLYSLRGAPDVVA